MLRTMLSLIYLFPSLFFGLHFFLSKKLVNFPTLENGLFLFELTFITCLICPCLHLHTLFFFISFIKFVGMFHINTFLLIAINNDVFNLHLWNGINSIWILLHFISEKNPINFRAGADPESFVLKTSQLFFKIAFYSIKKIDECTLEILCKSSSRSCSKYHKCANVELNTTIHSSCSILTNGSDINADL